MASTLTTAQARQQVLAFAAEYPTPNVQRGVALAKAGTITWEQLYGVCRVSMETALAVVQQPTPPRAGLVLCPNGCGHWVVEGAYIDPTLPCP
jgi:hypothetical protein